ncbi:MAG: NarK/NasA family nitrate transporter [Chloroflexota bacterium]|nr:NarK/NasA family nitrate transporter [Chloroflexota bacterium]
MKDNTPNRQLFLTTIAFTVAFANWGLISGLATLLKSELRLSAMEASLMIALPVILGSVGRIPMGLLTDRYGGRLLFSALLIFGLIPPTALALNHSYSSLLFWGFWLGLAGSSFAIGIGFVSLWFPPERQGTALGVYGVGNIGQSVAVFFGPVLANRIGIPATLAVFGLASLGWGLVFAIWSRKAPRKAKPKTLQESVRVLYTKPLSWALSLFYFLTFGGFVALGIYLPTLLKETFLLMPEDAGARTAGFIILATLARPVGGWLSDRVGGQRLLVIVFLGIALLAWLMAMPSIIVFTISALGCAALLGLGNGAVFKLVAQYFPAEVGTVTGLVGAAGGLGGFFPPIVLGALKDTTGSFALGFVLLSAFALGCWFVLWAAFLRVHRLPKAKPGVPVD